MVTKTIRIDVKGQELDELNGKLGTTKKNIDKIEGSSKKAATGLKSVGENGGAIATLDSFTGGLATKLRDAAEATKLFSFSLKGVQSALIATGIGALVVALGLIVAYWDDIVDYITSANEKLQRQLDYSRRIQEELSFELELLKLKEEILITEGKNTDEILVKRRELIGLLQIENKQEIQLLKTQRDKLIAKIQEITLLEAITSYATGNRGFVGVSEKESELLATITKGLDDATKQALELDLALAKLNNPGEDKDKGGGGGTETKKRDKLDKVGNAFEEANALAKVQYDALKKTFDTEKYFDDQLKELREKSNNEFLNSKEVTNAKALAIEESRAEYSKRVAQAEADAKIETLYAVSNALTAAGDAVGKQTAVGKGLAISGALINTYLGITEVLSSESTIPEPFGTISKIANSLAIGAAGFSAVKSISSIKVPGASGGGGGSIGGGSPSRPPSFNVVGNNPQNQLNQALLEKNNQPVQAFVVDKDVTTGQELRRNKIESSSL
jgi:hypothetical protein